MTPRRLVYFAAVLRHGTIARAAADLGLAPAAVSMQIAALEADLGVSLFDRHARGVRPTPAGERLARRIGDFERLATQTMREVRQAGGGAPVPLSIGLPSSLVRLVGADTVVDAATRLPNRQVRLVEELSVPLAAAAERRELDMAFAFDAPELPGLHRTPISEDVLLYVTAPAFATGTGPIRFVETLRQVLYFAGETGIVPLVRRHAHRLGLVPDLVSDIRSVAALPARLQSGGASLMPHGSVLPAVAQGLIVARPVIEPVLTRTLTLLTVSDAAAWDDPDLQGFLRATVHRILDLGQPYAQPLTHGTWLSDSPR